MNRANLPLLGMIVAQITVIYLMSCCFIMAMSTNDLIKSAPFENVTVPLGQTTPVNFSCSADGDFALWAINGTYHHQTNDPNIFRNRITFYPDVPTSSGFNISMGMNVTTATNNNTEIHCAAAIVGETIENSTTVTLTIAGPPLPPHPEFHVVNATHIEVRWDKPFALPEVDIQKYTVLIVNTSSENSSTINGQYSVSADTAYPIRHYISNGGDIAMECVYLRFIVTATNDAGASDPGSVTGGFPIAPPPILDDSDSLQILVTFTPGPDFAPILLINFTFPEVCDYHDAKYSVLIFHDNGSLAYRSIEKTYDKDSPDSVEVEVSENLQKDLSYTAQINVSTAVNWTITQFPFDTKLNDNTTNITPDGPKVGGIEPTPGGNQDTAVITSSAFAGGLCIILLGLIIVLLATFIMRRRKLKERNRAHQRELETDEARQRATEAMITNPLYSGYPIYEEIDSVYMLGSLRNGVPEAASKDDGYVAISTDTVKYVSNFPLSEESKVVQDKYETFPEDMYTVMNPAGTLSGQNKGPAYEEPFMHNGTGAFQEQHSLTETMTNGGQCAAAAGSAPATAGFTTQDNSEERQAILNGFLLIVNFAMVYVAYVIT